MEYYFTKIRFKQKEYIVVSVDEEIPIHPDYMENINKTLSKLFGEDSDDVIFYPTKVNFYGFQNGNNQLNLFSNE